MKTSTIFAAALAALVAAPIAAPVAAQTVSAGEQQLAASLGVEPGLYSVAQLVQLRAAMNDSDSSSAQTIAYILDNPKGDLAPATPNVSTRGEVTEGAAQLARQQGVEPGRYTVAELVLLDQYSSDSADSTYRDAILKGEVNANLDDGISAGKAQLAASLGVDPADYTSAELAAMYTDRIMD